MDKPVYLVAIDGSDYSNRAAYHAIKLAKQTNADVHFVTVVSWSKYQPFYIAEVSAQPIDRQEEEKLERENLLEPLEKEYADSGVNITSKVFWGHPVEEIHNYSKKAHAAMIFVGRRGRSKIADLVMGSVANSIAHTAGVPVVLIP